MGELLMSNYGEELENNKVTGQVELEKLLSSNIHKGTEETEVKEKNSKSIDCFIKSLYRNKKIIMIFSGVLIFVAVVICFSRQFSKPESKYEEDSCYKSFVKDNDSIYYSYILRTGIEELMEKRGIYNVNVNSSNIVKISDEPARSINLYKNDIYYINSDDHKIYKMRKDGSGNRKISDDEAVSLIVDKGYIYYRNTNIEDEDSTIFRMKLDGRDKKVVSKDTLSYNIVGDYIYYSSKTSLGDVYRINTDGSHKKKVCKISGVLKYIKDNYIYYSMSLEKPKDVTEFIDNASRLNKVKLDGTNPTRLSDETVLSFFVDKNNDVYYEENCPEDFDSTSRLYKVNSDGTGKTKLAERTSKNFYIENDKVYYFEVLYDFPCRKDFKGGKAVVLLDMNEKEADEYRNEISKLRIIHGKTLENFNSDINMQVVVTAQNKGENKVLEAYHLTLLDNLIENINSPNESYMYVTKFINENSNNNLDSIIELQFKEGRIRYTTFKKDNTDYIVDEVLFFEGITRKEESNALKYILNEKIGDPEEKGLEILTIDKKDVRS